jgi:tetratricopeptide (TPR) repeat protein
MHSFNKQSLFGRDEHEDIYATAALGWLYPQRLVYPGDAAFDDLAALVPALVAGPDAGSIDAWQREVTGGGKLQPIDPAAAALLARARAALSPGVYRWGDAQVAIDPAGNLGWMRTVDTGLEERGALVGRALVRDYPELDLAVRRANASPLAVALATLPIAVAADDDYRAAFAVRARGDHAIALTRPAAGGPRDAFVLSFDAAAHLVGIADGDGAQIVAVTWGVGGPTAARVDGRAVSVGYDASAIGDAAAWARGGATADVAIELPLRTPASWQTKLAALTPGSTEWRTAQRQYLASLATTQNDVALAGAYRALVDHGGASVGDLVIAAPSLATLEDGPAAGALAPLRDTAVARYLAAGRRYARGETVRDVPDAHQPGLVSALWSVREIAAELAASHDALAIDRAIAMPDTAAQLKLLAVATVATRLPANAATPAARIAALWDSVATGTHGNLARAQAATTAIRVGSVDAAAELVARYVDNLDLAAPPAAIPGAPYLFEQSRRGHAGWEMVWARWRDRVLAGTSFDHALALIDMAIGQQADAPRVIARAAELAGDDVDRALAVAGAAARQGQYTLAESLLQRAAARSSRRAVHDQLAALELQQGRSAEALVQLEAAQDAPDADDGTVPLQVETAQLAQIMALAQNVALGSTGPARDAVLRDARRFGARWRTLAPADARVDVAMGDLALAVGDTKEAWRQLSTAIERDPMSGAGYELVADAFETQGKVAEAVGYWDQAVRIDQTDPTPRLREARALAALGRDAEADKILRDVAGRAWHERWDGVVEQAKELLARRR